MSTTPHTPPAIGGHGTSLLLRFGALLDEHDDAGPGGWDGSIDDLREAAAAATVDAPADPDPAPAADPAPAPAADPAPAAAADAPPAPPDPNQQPGETVAEWRQRFADETAMWQGYREAESAKTRAEQRAAELERSMEEYQRQVEEWAAQVQQPAEPADPLATLALGVPDELYDRIVANAQTDLPGTAKKLYEALPQLRERYGAGIDEVASQLMQAWANRDFLAAQDFMLEQRDKALEGRMQETVDQGVAPLAPFTQQMVTQRVNEAAELAAKEAEDFPEHAQEVFQYVLQNSHLLEGTNMEPEKVSEVFLRVAAVFRDEKLRRARRTAAAAPAPPAAPQVPASAAPQPVSALAERSQQRQAEIFDSWDSVRLT
jgi:hypothetical protein